MNIADIVIGAAVLAVVFLALRSLRNQKKNGRGCCGDCCSCHAKCDK